MGTKTITMYLSDLDQSEIPAGKAYQLSIRHPDGSTQQLDISEKNYRDLKLAGVGKTLKKRGRKPGATTAAPPPRASAARARTANRPPPPDPSTRPGDRLGVLTAAQTAQLSASRRWPTSLAQDLAGSAGVSSTPRPGGVWFAATRRGTVASDSRLATSTILLNSAIIGPDQLATPFGS